jgi:hypothetical protein
MPGAFGEEFTQLGEETLRGGGRLWSDDVQAIDGSGRGVSERLVGIDHGCGRRSGLVGCVGRVGKNLLSDLLLG